MSCFKLTAVFGAGLGIGILSTSAFFIALKRRLGRFLSFAAHEINTPLTAAAMTTVNLLDGALGKISPEQRPWFEILREQIVRLTATIGDLRDFIHFHLRDGLSLKIEPVDSVKIIDEAVSLVTRGFSQAGTALRVTADNDLPAINGDRERLERIFLGILYHCRKFRTSGDVDVRAQKTPTGAKVSFAYFGTELSLREARRSLNLFYPARLRRDQLLTSTGLGLGALKVLANLQGGDISIRTDETGRVSIAVDLVSALKN
ncbi:MAG: sensor histidine kinase [Elusimicrobiota bacterium]